MPVAAETLTYILDGPNAVPEADTHAWPSWMLAALETGANIAPGNGSNVRPSDS